MNKLRYKLVFSKRLGMLVPIAEIAKSHQTGKNATVVFDQPDANQMGNAQNKPLWRVAFGYAALMLSGLMSMQPLFAFADNTLPSGGSFTLGAGTISPVINNNTLNINTTTNAAIIRWDSFSVGKNATVNFAMPTTSSSVLNRVMGTAPSHIYGSINANGHVYIVNHNGIFFGNGAQINVGSLTATTLDDINSSSIETIYNNGILSDLNNPVFSFAGAVGSIEVAGEVLDEKGQVVKEAAKIKTTPNGRVMLLAPDVTNSGVINTPDGQTILAAGKTVYLSKANENIMVEVSAGGTAKNLGEIVVGNGHASLVGLAVNQEGVITATTSVRNNGEILLKAKEIQSLSTPGNDRYGTVTLAKGSKTQVLVDVENTELAKVAQEVGKNNQSIVNVEGKDIHIEGALTANAGVINVTGNAVGGGESKIYLGDEAKVDVSGVDANAPMSRNQLSFQLFSEQLKDSPILRGGPLFGKTIYLDARKGTSIVSQSVIEQVKDSQDQTIAEAMTNGGSVSFTADNVISKTGSTVNTSGGVTTYAAGNIKETKLLLNGKWINASEAKAGVAYQGIDTEYSVTDARFGVTRTWNLSADGTGNYQAGYTEGGDAGAYTVNAKNLALQGNVLANTVVGTYQRGDSVNPDFATPLGGALNINYNGAGTLNFVSQLSNPLDDTFTATSELSNAQKATSEISTNLLNTGNNHLTVNSNGQVNVNAALNLKAKGSVAIDANAGLNVNANINVAGGNVTLSAAETANVVLGSNVTVNTSGFLTNDLPGIAGAMTGLIVKDGGNITVNNGLVMASGAKLEANAGAWLKQNRTLEAGHGGDVAVTLAQNTVESGAFSSYGIYANKQTSAGGKLTLNLQGEGATSNVKDIAIGGTNPNLANTLWLDEGFFSRGGFSSFALSNEGRIDGDVVIGSQTTSTFIQPKQTAKILNANYLSASTGTAINQVTSVSDLPAFTRNPTSLSIHAGDDLTLHAGASIVTEVPTSTSGKHGNVDLSSHGQMTILGDISAPAADISLTLLKTAGDTTRPNGTFDPTLSLYVGENANLSAKGQYITPPTADGNLRSAQVADAGKINITAENGVVILKQGSQLDVSATSGNVDLQTATGYSRQQVDGSAGVIELNARDGLAADGALLGKASGQGAAGTLKVVLGGENSPGTEGGDPLLFFTNGQRVLTVTQNQQVTSATNQAGGSVSNLIETNHPTLPLTNAVGKGQISQAQIAAGGFDNIDLQVKNVNSASDSRIAIETGTVLTAPSRLSLDATSIAGAGTINAATVTLKNTTSASLSTPTQGTGELLVNANFIDIIGNVTLDQVNAATLNSRSDIRGRGNAKGLQSEGSLTAPNQLTLDAKQIYPTTATTFNIKATGAQSRVEIKNTQGTTPAVPMSAQGKLNIDAAHIVQSGNLRAPLGEINLNATESLTLSNSSLTSVSAEGSVIPYLTSVLGGNSLVEVEEDQDARTAKNKLNEKKVTLSANNIDLQNGAKVDISGGGDTFAYEWLPGIGGSENVLAEQGYYAVLPSLGQQYAPYDYLMSGGNTSGLQTGQAVYLNGGDGLAAGVYTLLPARYALVPGAYLVKATTATLPINASLAQLDGSSNMSGYMTQIDGTSRGQFATFNVTNGRIFYDNVGTKDYKGPAEYLVTYGNQHFIDKAKRDGTTTPQLSADAGQLSINANGQLNLAGQIVAQKTANGKGGLVDISSNKIQVVSNVGAGQAGVLQLSAEQLSNIQADSVLLGGSRTVSGNEHTITTQASEVSIENDANHAIEKAELILTAKDSVTVKANAAIKTTASASNVDTLNLKTTGDGALLAVSANNDLGFTRTGATGNTGALVVEQNATVEASRSAVLDSTKSFDKSGDVLVGANGSLTLGSQQFALGDVGASTATKVDTATLQSYGQLASVTLNSYKQIDLFGGFNFGNNNLNLTLNTTGLAHQGVGDVVINAKNLTLNNTLGTTFVTPGAQNSQLTFNTENTTFGTATQFNIAGFNAVNLNADQAIKLSGSGNANFNATQTTLKSAVVTADTGAKYNLSATGTLDTVSNGNQAAQTTGLGANVTLSSRATTIGNRIEVLAGQVQATSTNGALKVSSDGKIITKAATVQFDENYAKTTDAGDVTLTSNTGNVEIAQNALIDVSGGATQGDAGNLNVNARNGQFIVADGTLKGTASANEQTGQFNLDVNQLPNFSDVNKALESGGFTQARDMRVRTGNVNIAATDTVTAKQFALGVDAGNIEVAGTVNADGAKGGDVAMYASGTVTLKNTAKITAKGTQANQSTGDAQTGSGGKVLLSSNSLATANAVSAETGALIDVSGYDKSTNNNVGVDGTDGSVTLRGRRGTSGTANTVNVAFNTTGAIKGASEVRVEGVRTYTATTFANSIAGLVTDTNSFYTANPGAGSYVNTQDGLVAQILPYIEVRSTTGNVATNMNSTADHNLRAFGTLQAGKGGVLVLRSSGDLGISSISDGFTTATTAGVLQPNTKTFDLSFIAGADYTSANVDKTVKGTGNLTLTNGKIIRTGEGDINLAAGNNMTLGTGVIYTAGKVATDAAGFTKPTSNVNASSYVNNGGDVRVMAQGDISATATTQSVNQWLLRQAGDASSTRDTSWWVRPESFQQGIAALGGGDVNVSAGGNISNVSASSATNAQYDNRGTNPTNNSVVNGGGDVNVSAGGNVTNGVYYVGRGKLNIDANGTIGKSGLAGSQGLLIALQDASAEVSAVGNVKVDTVFNPTLWAQGSTNSAATANHNYFNTYSNQASFDVASLVGAVQLGLQHKDDISSTTGLSSAAGTLKNHDYGAIHPGIVNATAFTGNITAYKLILAPSLTGQLQLLAANNVTGVTSISTGSQSQTASVIISDGDVTNQFTINQPLIGNVASSTLNRLVASFKTGNAATPVHRGDSNQSAIIARDGNVDFKGTPAKGNANVYGVKSAMPMYISAGKDVTMHASIQHNNDGDITNVKAGNDFVMQLANTDAVFEVQGPGNLVVEAGRNINLGKTTGILSVANTKNANLSEVGANISLLAGLGEEGAAVSEFVSAYIDPTGAGPTPLSAKNDSNEVTQKRASYRNIVAKTVQSYMQKRTGAALTETQAMQLFLALDADKQKPLVYDLFGVELTNAIVDYVETANTARGDQVIASLFPKTNTYEGDMLMYQSQVKTLRFADINLLTPGGLINAGVPSSNGNSDNIGIVTEKGGALRVYADKGFEINQSKVATLFGVKGGGSDKDANGNLLGVRGRGSDLSAWVNNGDIDAGRGSKTAISVPKRLGVLDDFGNRIVELKGVAAGSGISTNSYDPDGPTGPEARVDAGVTFLAAPRGTLDAGEAGVSSGSDLFLGAQLINNATNITAAGSSSGVPVADTGSLAGSLAGMPDTAAGVTSAMAENLNSQLPQDTATKTLPPIVSVKTIRLED